MDKTRRSLLIALGLAPAALLVARSASAQATAACYDPATLSLSQKSRRRGLGFVDQGPDAAKRCCGCAFFTAGEGGCGTCQLLNGPVTALSTCNSFAPRAG